jgi:dTMP kinase
MNGIFITFEGPDGAGKTTQIQLLTQALREEGRECVATREPGGTFISDQIRAILLNPEHKEMAARTEVLLYAASRAQHVHEVIIPALAEGKIVLCDRYIDASIAYQAYGLGADLQHVELINRYASDGLQPHRTYMLDIPVEAGMERLHRRSGVSGKPAGLDRIEQRERDYHSRVRAGFQRIAEQAPDRVLLVRADRSAEEVAEEIMSDCKRLLHYT